MTKIVTFLLCLMTALVVLLPIANANPKPVGDESYAKMLAMAAIATPSPTTTHDPHCPFDSEIPEWTITRPTNTTSAPTLRVTMEWCDNGTWHISYMYWRRDITTCATEFLSRLNGMTSLYHNGAPGLCPAPFCPTGLWYQLKWCGCDCPNTPPTGSAVWVHADSGYIPTGPLGVGLVDTNDCFGCYTSNFEFTYPCGLSVDCSDGTGWDTACCSLLNTAGFCECYARYFSCTEPAESGGPCTQNQ